jgi:hypothetical protein
VKTPIGSGEGLTDCMVGFVWLLTRVTVAKPLWLLEPEAVTVTVGEFGIVAGAVNKPVVSIFPAVAVHVTVDCPVSVNCCVAPSATWAVAGETVIVTVGEFGHRRRSREETGRIDLSR